MEITLFSTEKGKRKKSLLEMGQRVWVPYGARPSYSVSHKGREASPATKVRMGLGPSWEACPCQLILISGHCLSIVCLDLDTRMSATFPLSW